ncbi:MAG: InlB B-repeat-containing protein [Lachnospiraceae bacterium]|nr:InlB B-repeat-containing protein [Lachnospiraceae bacterium]
MYQPNENIYLTQDTTLYAVWHQLPTITYNANGGSWNGETTRIHWDKVGNIYYPGMEAPEREGYEFRGWMDINGNPVDSIEIVLEDGIHYTFYAKWEKMVTVTYITNLGGWGWYEDGEYETTSFVREEMTGEYSIDGWTPNCNDEPYVFAGYSTNPNSNVVEYVPGQIIQLQENLILYAVWNKMAVITYSGNGGTWDNQNKMTDYSQAGRMYYVRFMQPDREGYEFRGWMDEDGHLANERAIRMESGDEYTFYAVWAKRITISYNANGGFFDGFNPNEGETESLHFRDMIEGDEYLLDGWRPQRDGYEFLGWTSDESQKDNPLTPVWNPDEVFQPADDVVLYAVWTESPVITYHANGGYFNRGDRQLETEQIENIGIGNYHVAYEWPEREGYLFLGWSEDPNASVASSEWDTILSGSKTFYAIWEQMPSITFVAGEGFFADGSSTRTLHLENERTMDMDWMEEPTREGYRFVGWLADGEPVEYIRLTRDMTLTAEWVKICTVTFHAGDGLFNNGENTLYFEFEEGELFHLNNIEDPVNEGYLFDGWMADGEFVSKIVVNEDLEFTACYLE